MPRRYAALVLQIAALVGVAVSALLMLHYAIPNAGLCGPGGGCDTVRTCRLANVGGVSWPVIGIVAFGVTLILALSTDERARRLLPMIGVGAGLTGVALLVLQRAGCHAFCKYCVVADSMGIVIGVAAWIGRDERAPVSNLARWAFGGTAITSLLAVFAYGATREPAAPVLPALLGQLPAPIAREQRNGVATIVEFADFECPYCRRQHAELSEVLASYGTRVRFVRKHVPLQFHQHAEGAARAACCGEELGRGDAMADALFRSEDITPAGCEAVGARLGLDLPAYRACLASPRTNARLAADREAATASAVQGLPTTFIGNERFEGVVPAGTLRASIDRALRTSVADVSGPRPPT